MTDTTKLKALVEAANELLVWLGVEPIGDFGPFGGNGDSEVEALRTALAAIESAPIQSGSAEEAADAAWSAALVLRAKMDTGFDNRDIAQALLAFRTAGVQAERERVDGRIVRRIKDLQVARLEPGAPMGEIEAAQFHLGALRAINTPETKP